jgi:hypothetical protein
VGSPSNTTKKDRRRELKAQELLTSLNVPEQVAKSLDDGVNNEYGLENYVPYAQAIRDLQEEE